MGDFPRCTDCWMRAIGIELQAIRRRHRGHSCVDCWLDRNGCASSNCVCTADNFPNSVLTAAYTFGMFQCAKSLQGDALEHRLANGATKGSGWAAAGIGILCLAVLTVASFAIVLVAPEEWFGEELSSP